MSSSISFNRVGLAWPDGTVCLDDVTAGFGPGVTAIVGDNGAGKSTLLRLVAGQLRPSVGTVLVNGAVGVLRQDVALDTRARVADLLGVGTVVDAVRAVTAGDARPHHFDAISDDWDVEARATEELAAAGLDLDLDRAVGTLSGGEATLAAIVGLRVRRTPIALLDEPTNNLDRPTRERVYDLVGRWPGTVLVVSHDIALLRRVTAIAELAGGCLTLHGGAWDDFRAAVETEQEAALRAVRAAEQQVRVERRQKVEAQRRLARRANAGRAAAAKGMSKAARDFYANRSEKAVGRARGELDARIDAAREAADAARARVREEASAPEPRTAAATPAAAYAGHRRPTAMRS